MNVALLGSIAADQGARLRRLVTSAVHVTDLPDQSTPEHKAEVLAKAEVVITLHLAADTAPMPQLKLLQVAGAGYDAIARSALPPGATVCNAHGHEAPISEYVFAAMLLFATQVREAEASFRQGSWAMSGRTNAPFVEELYGKTIGILGMGKVGEAVAHRAAAFGMRVIACSRRRTASDAISAVFPLAAVGTFLSECDYVVVSCALDSETHNLIDRAQFDSMKQSAVLINIARGTIVNEEALYESLRSRRIKGAAIDTWYSYPSAANPNAAPSRFPFAALSNVIMTPHSSAWTAGMIERRWRTIAENVDRMATGQPLLNVVYQT